MTRKPKSGSAKRTAPAGKTARKTTKAEREVADYLAQREAKKKLSGNKHSHHDNLGEENTSNNKVARRKVPEVLSNNRNDADLGAKLDKIAKRHGLSRDQFLRVAGGDDPDHDLSLTAKEEPKKPVNLVFDPDFYAKMEDAAGEKRITEWLAEIIEHHVGADDYMDIEVPKPKRNMNPPESKTSLSPSLPLSLIDKLDEVADANQVRRSNVIQSLVQREMGMSVVPGVYDRLHL